MTIKMELEESSVKIAANALDLVVRSLGQGITSDNFKAVVEQQAAAVETRALFVAALEQAAELAKTAKTPPQ